MTRRLVRCAIHGTLCTLVLLALATPALAQNTYYGKLTPGQSLAPGDWLVSPSGNYGVQFILRPGDYFNGALVFFNIWQWANLWTDPGPHPRTPGSAIMQSDGNFVLYSPDCTGPYSSCWSTGTYGHDGAYLRLGDDGSLGVYGVDDVLLWCHPSGAPCPAPSTIQGLSPYGMVTHMLYYEILAQKMVELGAGVVRVDFPWDRMQPARGADLDFIGTGIDATVANAKKYGLTVFASLGCTPGWANGGQGCDSAPWNMQDWYDFVNKVALHYQDNHDVMKFGIWNEPDLSNMAFTDYWSLVINGRQAIKDAIPSANVLGPEVSVNGVCNGWYSAAMTDFGWAFDIVTVHYYFSACTDPGSFMDGYVHPYLNGKSVWVTEAGWNSCDPGYWNNGELSQQSAYYTMLSAFAPRRSYWTQIFFYHLWAPSENGCGYSIVKAGDFNWTNRPAFGTYQAWIQNNP